MSLPAPNLDDRRFSDIVEEAKKQIPRYCPQWTDFNDSDPGITLIQLMAWMTESIIYRLNRVPGKNFINFLRLMGIDLRPPQPARAWLVFIPAEGAEENQVPSIPAGTNVSTDSGAGEPIPFQTVRHLNLTTARPQKAFSKYKELQTDHNPVLSPGFGPVPVPLFAGDAEDPHILYLGDAALPAGGQSESLTLYVDADPSHSGVNLQWECMDGDLWIPVVPLHDTTAGLTKSGEIHFDRLPNLQITDIPPHGRFWLRARLVGLQGRAVPRINRLERGFEIKEKYGVKPRKGFFSTEDVPAFPLDFSAVVHPFGKEPRTGGALHIGSSFFAKKGARITLGVKMSETYTSPDLETVKNLQLTWEYLSLTGTWKLLGTTAATGVERSEHSFADETDAFTKSGKITFTCPPDTGPGELPEGEDHWVRARITKGDFGKKTPYPPRVKEFLLTYDEKPVLFEHYLTRNYSTDTALAPAAAGEPFTPFDIDPEQSPAFFLAFDRPLSNLSHRIYFRLSGSDTVPASVSWEYYGPGGWTGLGVTGDGTRDFSQSGAIEFVAPADWTLTSLYNREGYWLRALWEPGDPTRSPLLEDIRLNAVEAQQTVPGENEILGSATGEPFQTVHFSRLPILPGPRIQVDEPIPGREDEFQRVNWTEVRNFYRSGPGDRHYTFDLSFGSVTFGDGKRGKIPPIGRDNIRCAAYYTGGGAAGNVGAGTLNVMETTYKYVESVTNPYPAGGGCDAETVEEAKLRGPWALEHRYRAVTGEDFERLAREASGEVAKATCYTDKDGVVKIVLLPRNCPAKPLPTAKLVEKVKKYLDERRLLTTRIDVGGAVYKNFTIHAVIVPNARVLHQLETLKTNLENELETFFHPLTGGPQGSGWPMGRNVHISEIYYLIEKMSGVDYVEQVMLNHDPWLKRIETGEMTFPYLEKVNINFI